MLWPFALLYNGITGFRNHLYNINPARSVVFDLPVISVGNLSTGGTGKTPMIEYLINLLRKDYAISTLSRGYKRKTKGFVMADKDVTVEDIGDEPFQVWRKFGPEVAVAVGEERAMAIPGIIAERPQINCILLDDAFQHRSVQPFLNILLTTYQEPFYKDYVLPVGNLREARKGASRADVVVVTKCPLSLGEVKQQEIKEHISRFTGDQVPVFFAGVQYGTPIGINNDAVLEEGNAVHMASGIAFNKDFQEHVKRHYNVEDVYEYADHHFFTSREVQQWKDSYWRHAVPFVVTEKDAMRLSGKINVDNFGVPLHYIPVEMVFLSGSEDFDRFVLRQLRSFAN